MITTVNLSKSRILLARAIATAQANAAKVWRWVMYLRAVVAWKRAHPVKRVVMVRKVIRHEVKDTLTFREKQAIYRQEKQQAIVQYRSPFCADMDAIKAQLTGGVA